MHLNVVFCAVVCTLPLAVSAQQWVRYAGSPGGDEGYLDLSSLQVRDGTRTIWTRLEKSEAISHRGEPLKTWFALTQVICEHRMHRTLQEAGYRPDGSLLFDTEAQSVEFRSVVPSTMGESRLIAICDLPAPGPYGRSAST